MKIIRKFFNRAEKIIDYLERTQLSFKTIFFSVLAIVSIRFFFESVFLDLKTTSYEEFIASYVTALLLFFLFSYVLTVIFVWFMTREELSKVASVVLWGQWLVVVPPIVDHIVFEGRPVWSFYVFDSIKGIIERYFTFFGDNPAFGITYGTRVEVLLVMIFLGLYIFIKRKKRIIWLVIGVLSAYTFSFMLGIIPNIITYFYGLFTGENLLAIDKTDIVSLFLTSLHYFDIKRGIFRTVLSFKMAFFFNIFLFAELAVLQFLANKKKFFALLKNVRYPQMVFNTGLMLIGICLGVYYFPQNLSIDMFSVLAVINLWITVFCAWCFSVIVNDLADEKIDRVSNSNRPLVKGIFSPRQFGDYAFVFLVLSLSAAIAVSDKTMLLAVLYLMVTWIYSQQPFRLRRFVFVSSVLSSFASLLFLIMGYILVAQGQALDLFPWKIVIFLFLSYALLIPIKDLKDIKGDKQCGIITLPTLVGNVRARSILGSLLFLSYFFSVIILNEKKLLVPAVLFGLISYYIMTSKKYRSNTLPWWVLGIVAIYGIILVLITFG